MTFRVRVLPGRKQDDEFQSAPPGEGEDDEPRGDRVLHFRRIRARGYVKAQTGELKFEIMLDMRARTLSVRMLTSASGPSAIDVGRALIREIAVFHAGPMGRLVDDILEDRTDARAEWAVADHWHVAGLLHRLAEKGEFPARQAMPLPRALQEVLHDLNESVISNAEAAKRLQGAISGRHGYGDHGLSRAAWEIHLPRFIELVDDPEMRMAYAEFFGMLDAIARASDIARMGQREHPDYTAPSPGWAVAAWSRAEVDVRDLEDRIRRRARSIITEYGTAEQKKHL